MKETKTSTAQKKATMKWTKANKEALNMYLNPGVKDRWKAYAAAIGMSLAEFIRNAVEEKAERDGLKSD